VERLILGAEAEAAKARLDGGEISFEDLVAERDLELTDIDLGDVTEAELDDAGAAVFAAEGPGLVGPVDTPLGAAIFRVNAVLAAQVTSFEDALPQLEEELGLEAAARAIGDEIEAADDLLAGGATLEEVAAETDLLLETVDWSVERTGGISDYAAFRRAAAALTVDDFPEVLELDDGGIFALRLEEVTEPRLQEFADARAAARLGWEAEATLAALTEAAAPIVAALEAGGTPEGLTPATETALTRDAFIPGASPELIIALFEMAPGEVRVIEGENAVEILRLDEVLPPDLEDETMASRRTRLEQATAQSISGDILAAFANAVQNAAGITLDQAAIQAVNVNLP
jgi:peptidyl-prolyl cis-trans isomerase D